MAKKDPVKEYLATIGRKGGKAEVPKGTSALSPEERHARAKMAAAARWGNQPSLQLKKPAKKKGKGN